MRAAAVGLALVALAGAASAQPGAFASAEGKYRAKFPGAPKVTEKTAKGAAGELTVSIATYALADGSVYLVSYTDYPAAVEEKNREKFFDAIRDELRGEGRLVGEEKERAVGAEKWPAREFTVERNRQRVRIRLVLRENRLYQAAVVGTADFVSGRGAGEFLDSLELTK